MTEYLVICREVCPACRGDGFLQNPQWRAYFADLAQGLVDGTESDLQAWWSRAGYDPAHIPPEIEHCDDCGTRGTIDTEVPLAKALEHMGVKR